MTKLSAKKRQKVAESESESEDTNDSDFVMATKDQLVVFVSLLSEYRSGIVFFLFLSSCVRSFAPVMFFFLFF